MFWLFTGKREINNLKENTKVGFESVKKDITAVSGWIKHLDSEKNIQSKEIGDIKEDLSIIKNDVESLKNMISILGNVRSGTNFRQPKQLFNKHTAVEVVQTAVETAVQTPDLSQFSVTERAILWILLNTDMKLSYEDLAAMLGKEKSTIRSQINTIRQKGEIVEESIEKNGKKRVFIPEEIKEIMLRKPKVRVKEGKRAKK